MRKVLKDEDVLAELKRLRKSGRESVRAGEIARKFSVDSVRALGALERVKRKLYKEDAKTVEHEFRAGQKVLVGGKSRLKGSRGALLLPDPEAPNFWLVGDGSAYESVHVSNIYNMFSTTEVWE